MNPILDASLRAIGLAAVAGLSIAMMRRRGRLVAPSFEHAIWTCVLAGMLAFALPKFTVRVGEPEAAPIESTYEAPVVTAPSTPSLSLSAPLEPTAKPIARWNWPQALTITWFAGVVVLLIRIATGLFLKRRALRDARKIPGDSAIPIEESDNALMPMTVGLLKARVVLPPTWRSWPEDRVHAVIAHELAHARRRDTVVALLAAVNKAIFWFHPLAWWLERRLAELAEFAADEAALDVTHDRHGYAEALVGIASYARPLRLRWNAAPVGFGGRGLERISSRIERILDTRTRTRSVTMLVAAALAIAAVVFIHLRRPTRTLWPEWPGQRSTMGISDDTQSWWWYRGRLPEEGPALEKKLESDPENEPARLRLSVYYLDSHQEEKRLKLIDWLMEHHPDSILFRYKSMLLGRPADAGEAWTERWRRAAADHPSNEYDLMNAASTSNRQDGVDFLKQGQKLNHQRFTQLLAQDYSRSLTVRQHVPLSFDFNDGELPFETNAKADLASSSDAMLIGLTGSLVVDDAATYEMRGVPFRDIAALHMEAISLLSRATSLDPSNRDWPEGLEGAKELGSSQMPPFIPGHMIIERKEDAARRLLSAPNPVYPATAGNAGTRGTVTFKVRIDPDGHVAGAALTSGPAPLIQAARDAVEKYVYESWGAERWVQTTVEVAFNGGSH